MKFNYSIISMILIALLSGCTTSSKVQEMIDASHKDYSGQLKAHDDSITVLKKSALTGLETSASNVERIGELEKRVEALIRQTAIIQDLANASKVMSAENTVKISNLADRVAANQEETDKIIARMTAIDKLYEEVLIRQYQAIADSANDAIASLREDGFSASTNAPVMLNDPIEIIAPDTAAPTNDAEPVMPSAAATME